MEKNILIVFIVTILVLIGINLFHKEDTYNLKLEKLKVKYSQKKVPPVDHSKHEILRKEFNSPQEVTEACISCHTERHKEVMASSHWNWERVAYIEGRGARAIGKKNLLNNFCIGSKSNEQACAKCHIGFGMTNDEFNFENARNVDCMVCHDNSEEYLKGSALAGYPDKSVNLHKVAQSVGAPKRSNCGSCHFYSGGGNNVKHGDLEEALISTDRNIDVHMASNGMDMECVTCHTAENHKMLGKLYSVSSENVNRSTCEQCHTPFPHSKSLLNKHTAKVSCQACHIPSYAKVNATKMSWKWSEAGKLKNGKPYYEEDEYGNHIYLSIKGEFTWEKDIIPDYIWFNGTADHYILGDTITSVPIQMNTLNGSHDDEQSKIVPVKIHRGDQIYDRKNNYLVQPKLYSSQEGDSAFWKDFSWGKASEAGMKRIGLPFSGDFAFVETEMYWPVNHMVAPKENAVTCIECHRRNGGRLASLSGFYMPGRDQNKFIDTFGIILIIFSFTGVIGHACMRVIFSIKRGKNSENEERFLWKKY